MTAKVLDALMQLFAHLAKEDGVAREELRVVKDFLYQQLPQDTARDFIDKFLRYSKQESGSTLEALCAEVNAELTAQQKFFVLIRLLELIRADREVTASELDAARRVSVGLNIPADDFEPIYDFLTSDKPRQLLHKNLLIISSSKGSLRGAYLEVEHFEGYAAVLHIESVDVYVMRYLGRGEPYLNGQPIRPEVVYFITPGSVMRQGRTSPIYYTDIVAQFLAPRQTERLSFVASGISYRFAGGHVGLHELSLDEQSGRMVALMGVSGAGKSTLLNLLNGNLRPTTGSVLLNGIDIHREPKHIEGVIGYVSQDDLLVEELTVYDNLHFNAQLCFGHMGPKAMADRVEKTLTDLGLWEIRSLQVGSPLDKRISGGQRKRLNIALELIREPGVLFIDEPTSGLSSRDSENVMDLLKELALRGTLVFVVIHQPSSEIFKMFDRLLLLDTGGYAVYYGNPLEGVRYFRKAMELPLPEAAECDLCGNVTPEQVFTALEAQLVDETGRMTGQRKLSPEQWYDRYREHTSPPTPSAPAEPIQPKLSRPDKLQQAAIFFWRDLKSKLANRSYLVVNLTVAPLLALALAYLLRYSNPDATNTTGYTLFDNVNLVPYLLTCILVSLFVGLTVSAEEILRDRKMRKREAFLHLSRHAYLLAKVVLLFILAAIQMAAYVWVGHAVLGIRELQGEYWFMLFSVTCFANLLGLNISSAFDSAVTIYILVPILLIPQIVLSGAMVRFDQLNPEVTQTDRVPIAADLMASRWAYEGLAVKQFKDNAYERHFFESDKQISRNQAQLTYWMPRVQSKLDRCLTLAEAGESPALTAEAKALFQMLADELKNFSGSNYPVLDRLRKGQFAPVYGAQVARLLESLERHYQKQLRAATETRDAVQRRLAQTGVDLAKLRQNYHNARLADVVTLRLDADRIREADGRLMVLLDPVFRRPPTELLGLNAQLYASSKWVAGRAISTYSFNVVVIWLMTVVLYITLYFDLFRRTVQAAGWLQAALSGFRKLRKV
jgi:ABC transport system ATP-binding/permease protein